MSLLFPVKPLTESRLIRKKEWLDIGDIVQTPLGKEAEVIGKREGHMMLRYLDGKNRNDCAAVLPHLLKRIRRVGEC